MIDEFDPAKQAELVERIREWAERNQPVVEWSRDSELSREQISLFLESGTDVLRDSLQDAVDTWEDEIQAWKWCLEYWEEELDDLWGDVSEDEEHPWDEDSRIEWLREHGVEFYADINMERLLRQTQAYVGLALNLEHPYQGWHVVADLLDGGYQECGEINDALKFFKINPRRVAEYFGLPKSQWPNYTNRIGREAVDPDVLFESWENAPYGGQYVFLMECDFEMFERIRLGSGPLTMLRGANVIIHDFVNGASGLEVPLIRDLEVKRDMIQSLYNDGSSKYGIQSCCDMRRSAWNGRSKEA